MTLFDRAMASAPRLLFWIAVLILVLSFLGTLLVRYQDLRHSFGLFAGVIFALSNALSDAFWPFVGAAVSWRMDRSLKVTKAEAAE